MVAGPSPPARRRRDEIADARQIGALRGGVAQAAGHLGRQLDRVRGDPKVAAVLADDPARHETFGGMRARILPRRLRCSSRNASSRHQCRFLCGLHKRA